jgi:hypothetical protein
VNKDLSSKLLIALEKEDDLASVYYMPGPEALRGFLTAASNRGVDSALIHAAEEAVNGFEQLIRSEAGDRAALQAALTAGLPDARIQFEMRNRQAAFKANSNLSGWTCSVQVSLGIIVAPSDAQERATHVSVSGFRDLRCLRPGIKLHISTAALGLHDDALPERTTVDGLPIGNSTSVLLSDWSSTPRLNMRLQEVGEVTHYVLDGTSVGRASAVDLYFGDRIPNFIHLTTDSQNPRKACLAAMCFVPSQVLIMDVLVEDGVWDNSEPEYCLYDTKIYGAADPNDRARFFDRVSTADQISALGHGVDTWRTENISDHTAMIRNVCDRIGKSPSVFRCYRLRVDYPIYGGQYVMAFPRPAC